MTTNNKTNITTLRIDPKTKEKMKYIMEKRNITFQGELIRYLIDEEYERVFLNNHNDLITRIIRYELANILYYAKKI